MTKHQNATDIIRVRRAITQAPGTCSEIAAELGISIKHASVYLGRLYKAGVIERKLAPELSTGNGRKPNLYFHHTHAW